jgi:hypothetical protein
LEITVDGLAVREMPSGSPTVIVVAQVFVDKAFEVVRV